MRHSGKDKIFSGGTEKLRLNGEGPGINKTINRAEPGDKAAVETEVRVHVVALHGAFMTWIW